MVGPMNLESLGSGTSFCASAPESGQWWSSQTKYNILGKFLGLPDPDQDTYERNTYNPLVRKVVVDPWHFGTEPNPDQEIRTTELQIRTRIRILLFSSKLSRCPVFSFYFLRVQLHQSSKIKTNNKKAETKVFFTFLLDDGKVRMRIQIRIRIRTNNDGSG